MTAVAMARGCFARSLKEKRRERKEKRRKKDVKLTCVPHVFF
jgi:hypothetical protein